MNERDKLIRFYKGTEGEETVIRLLDLAEAVRKTGKFRTSNFLDPFGQEIAEVVAANYDLHLDFDGGYEGAERKCAIFSDINFLGKYQSSLKLITALWNEQFARLSHRDVLGALMGLGIDRQYIGDLLISLGQVNIICTGKITDFILNNLTSIGTARVNCSYGDITTLLPREEKFKEISATVASLRLDSVAASGYGTSRSRMSADIAAEKLKLNWQHTTNPAQTVKQGDVISMRGKGRLEVTEVRGKTKKGRISLRLKRYL